MKPQRTAGSDAKKLWERSVGISVLASNVRVPRVIKAHATSILEHRHDSVVPRVEAVQIVAGKQKRGCRSIRQKVVMSIHTDQSLRTKSKKDTETKNKYKIQFKWVSNKTNGEEDCEVGF